MVSRQKDKNVGGVYSCYILLVSFVLFSMPAVAKTKPDVSLTQTDNAVWQRQQLVITLTVSTDDPFSRLLVDDFKQAGFTIIPTQQERQETASGTRLVIHWVIIPYLAGKHTLELPRIRYRPNRGRIITLDLHPINLVVHHLPVYVPATMPVGKLTLTSTSRGHLSKWIETGKLTEWNIQLTAQGISRDALPPISSKLVSSSDIQFFPVQKTLKRQIDANGIHQTVQYTIPFKALSNGKLSLPALSIQYFDPDDAKLKQASLAPPTFFALNKWLQWLIFLFGLSIIISVSVYFIFRLKLFMRKYSGRRQAFKQLGQATSYAEIKTALSQLATLEGWNKNLSLTQFYQQWNHKYGDSASLKETLQALQACQFSAENNCNIQVIRQVLLQQLK